MRSPRLLTVALAATSWVALSYGALFLAFVLLDAFLDGRPRVLQALWLAANMALLVYAPPAFPFWRARLTIAERRRLFFGSGGGGAIGAVFGAIAGLAVLEPDFTAATQSTRSMTVLWSCIAVSSLAGAYLTARNLPLFAPATPPRLDEPVAADSAA